MPPKIDLSALPPLDQIKGASIGSLNKTQLLAVAIALEIPIPGLPKDITVKDLKPQVLEALKLPKFATDPRFLKFLIHRPATTGAASVKNSADKSAQDAQAAVQDSNAAPTGAYRTLIEKNVEADPPPKFKVLANGEHKGGAAGLLDIKDDESSLSSSQSEVVKPSSQAPVDSLFAHKVAPSPAGTIKDQAPEFAIIVKFTGGGSSESREVYILPPLRQGIPVEKGPGDAYLSSLKKLIPAALANFSSLNEFNDMKLTVTGLTGNLLSLGSAGEFRKGNIPPVLELKEADTCLLSRKMTPLGPVLILEVHWARPVGGSAINTKFKPSKITGDIKPLDLANQRATSKKPKETDNSDAEPDAEEGFLAFLNSELRGSEVPDYALGVTLKTVGQMLVRYNDLKQAISICDNGWVRKGKGRGSAYCVPAAFAEHTNPSYHQYASRRFNKAEIEDALDISKGVASGDRGLFEHKALPFVDDAQKWVEGALVRDEDRATKSAFDKMAPKEWKHYLETSKKQGDKEREKEARKNKDEKRKRRAESEAEAKDAKKRQRRYKSVDMAAGSEEDEEIILQRKLQEIKRKKRRAAAAAMSSNESGSDGAQAGPSRGRSRKTSSHLDSESDSAHA